MLNSHKFLQIPFGFCYLTRGRSEILNKYREKSKQIIK